MSVCYGIIDMRKTETASPFTAVSVSTSASPSPRLFLDEAFRAAASTAGTLALLLASGRGLTRAGLKTMAKQLREGADALEKIGKPI